MSRRVSAVALSALMVAALGLSACSTLSRVNPFKKEEAGATASEGQRISIVAFNQKVEASDALKGVDFQLPAPQATDGWPQPGGTAENGVDHTTAAPAFEIAWRKDIGQGSGRKAQITAPPVAAGDLIYTLDGEAGVAAHRLSDGGQAWRANLANRTGRDKEGFGGGLALGDGKLFVTSGFRFVAALDPQTGAVLWRRDVATPVHGAPTFADGRVYVVDVDNQLLALDSATGEVSWNHQALIEPARLLRASSPAVQGDFVVAPFSSGELVALRAANGNQLWAESLSQTSRTNALSEIRDIAGRPVIYRDEVFAVSHSGVFAAIDLRSGERRWELPVASVTTPLPAGDVVYVLSQSGELIAVSRDSGQAYWIKDLNEGRTRKEGGFLGIGDRTVRPIWAGPVLASNRLVVVNSEGQAVALDPKTGEVQKTLKLGGPAFLAPSAVGGRLYVVTDEGQLVAIR